MTPWDRAMDNWSLFTLNFILDYTNRPLKTHYFLSGVVDHYEIELLPYDPQKRLYEIESEYIPQKMVSIAKKRRGGYDSIATVWSETYLLDIKNYVK